MTLMRAANGQTTSAIPPLAVLLETRVRGLAPKNAPVIGSEASASSTLRWGSWQIYDGTAVDRLVGLDYFGARYFSAAQGRFTSPDLPFIDQRPEDPQSWNLYAYGRNNPLAYVDPTGHYVCGTSVSAEECGNFKKSLEQAQVAANALKDKYGADSKKYKDAQRTIGAYGAADAKNGVTINVGETARGASTAVAVAIGPRTADNPTGQNINVTFNPGTLSGDNVQPILAAHEGSHVADGSAWVASGFSAALNPTNYATEFRAYQVTAGVGEGLGGMFTMLRPASGPFLLSVQGWPQASIDSRINLLLRQEYHLTPADATRAFHRMMKVTK
jgi:RHS repeat-associated protein